MMTFAVDELSERELDQLNTRLQRRREGEAVRSIDPGLRPMSQFEREKAEHDERQRQERIAAAKAEEDRQRAEREAEERRRREEYERNAPQRRKAEGELAKLTPKLAALDAEREGVARRVRELQEIASR